jgi:hypothetical protein
MPGTGQLSAFTFGGSFTADRESGRQRPGSRMTSCHPRGGGYLTNCISGYRGEGLSSSVEWRCRSQRSKNAWR